MNKIELILNDSSGIIIAKGDGEVSGVRYRAIGKLGGRKFYIYLYPEINLKDTEI